MPELNPYARFIDGRTYLEERPILEALEQTPAILDALAQAIGRDRLLETPAPGKWSPAEILCHLADCELAFGFRLRQTLAEDDHVMQPFDQDKWAVHYPHILRDDAEKGGATESRAVSAGSALAVFTALRHWNILLVQAAPPEAGAKRVTHPERGTMTFTTILETMAGHDRNHIQQLEKFTVPTV